MEKVFSIEKLHLKILVSISIIFIYLCGISKRVNERNKYIFFIKKKNGNDCFFKLK